MATVHDRRYDMLQETDAQLAEVNGVVVPTRFADAKVEEHAARNGAAVAARDYIGRISMSGKDVLDLLERISSNNITDLPEGQARPTMLLNDKGRIIDLFWLLRLKGRYLVLTTRGMAPEVRAWIDKFTIVEDVTSEDVTAQTFGLTLVGPKSGALVRRAFGVDAPHPGAVVEVSLDGADVIIARTDPLGIESYDVVVDVQAARQAWAVLLKAGAQPVGEETLEGLRIEAGWPGRGTELTEEHNPLEAGLRGAATFRKCYTGQEVVARLDTYKKLQRRLVRLSLSGAVERGTELQLAGKRVGQVTSVATLATGASLGLAYVRSEAAVEGAEVTAASGVVGKVLGVPEPLGHGDPG